MQNKFTVTIQGVGSIKEYVPLIFAAVLLIIPLALIVAGINNLAGWPVLSSGNYALGYLAGGNFSSGVFAAGIFSAGVFAAGVFAVGVFSIGIFSLGIFSIGIFNIGILAIGINAIEKFAEKLVLSKEENK